MRASLRVAAESFCHDRAAGGRTSKRVKALDDAIRHHVGAAEGRRQAHMAAVSTSSREPKRPTAALIRKRTKALLEGRDKDR